MVEITNLHAVDTNGFSIKIDERPSRITEGDGSVSLYVLWHIPALQAHLARWPSLVAHNLSKIEIQKWCFEGDEIYPSSYGVGE